MSRQLDIMRNWTAIATIVLSVGCVLACPPDTPYLEVDSGKCVQNCSLNYFIQKHQCFPCHKACVGCHGPRSGDCTRCLAWYTQYYWDKPVTPCVENCPADKPYRINKDDQATVYECARSCGDMFIKGHLDYDCVEECPTEYVVDQQCSRMTSCPEDYPYSYKTPQHTFCKEVCPDELFQIPGRHACFDGCPPDYPYMSEGYCLLECIANAHFYNTTTRFCLKSCPELTYDTCSNTCPPSEPFLYDNMCNSSCPDDKQFYMEGPRECQTSCSLGYLFVASDGQCLSDCDGEEMGCRQMWCPSGMLRLNNSTTLGVTCTASCPDDAPFVLHDVCMSVCPPDKHLHVIQGNTTRCVKTCPADQPFQNDMTCEPQCPEMNPFREGGICRENCSQSKPFYTSIDNNYQCYDECLTPTVRIPGQFICLAKCPDELPFVDGIVCVRECPRLWRNQTRSECISECVSDDPYDSSNMFVDSRMKCQPGCPSDEPFAVNQSCYSRCPRGYIGRDTTSGSSYRYTTCKLFKFDLNESDVKMEALHVTISFVSFALMITVHLVCTNMHRERHQQEHRNVLMDKIVTACNIMPEDTPNENASDGSTELNMDDEPSL